MADIKKVGHKIRYSVGRLDGGLNTNDAPSMIDPSESPDCLNIAFDYQGAAITRNGSAIYNTSLIGSFPILGGISYNQTMFVWANGSMYRASGPSGSTFTVVTSSSGKYSTTAPVQAVVYQNVMFSSDGTSAWKYTGSENFYNMGITVPSACTGVSAASVAPAIQPGTYYYAVSNVNTQVVEGQVGSASAGVIVTATGCVSLSQIPVGSSLAGVNARFIYRADAVSGPFRKVGAINDNTTTTYVDNLAIGGEGKFAVIDGTAPTPWTTIALHKERLFFDDSSNKSLVRWTDFTNPYISEAENFEPISNGDGENIIAIASQDDFLTMFKSNNTFALGLQDPSDSTTWIKTTLPANLGIVGPRAFARIPNGLLFVGQRNFRITGVHQLTGLQVLQGQDGRLRTIEASQKIEPNFLSTMPKDYWTNIACFSYNNRFYMAYTLTSSTINNRMLWLDLNRIQTDGEPGSWSVWSGINASMFFNHLGLLYSGDSTSTGFIRNLEIEGRYNDSGSAIDSYFWTKEIGGEEESSIDAYVKDFRDLYIWAARTGNYNINVRTRVDGDASIGQQYQINVSPGTSLWGTMVWGIDPWGGTRTDFQTRLPIGRTVGRRIQVRIDNQNTVNQGFKVHRIEVDMNLRRRR